MESEESVTTEESTIGFGNDVVFNKDLFENVEVSKYHEDVNTTYVHVKYFDTKPSIVKHLLPELNN